MASTSLNLRNGLILRAYRQGYDAEAISRMCLEPIERVERVLEAHRVARGMLSRGYEPRVVYANFRDLLTRAACGL